MIFSDKFSYLSMSGDDQWRLPLALAIGLHALGFILILFPPEFLFPHRDLTEVQTINLFDAGELVQSAASGPKQSANSLTKKASPPESKKEETAPKPEPKKEEPPPTPPKPEPPPEPSKPEPVPEPPKPEPVPEPPKPEPPPKPEKVLPVEPLPKPIPPPEKAISLEPKKMKKKVAPEKPAQEKPKPEVAKPEKAKPEKPTVKADDKILKSLERIQARVKEKQENQALKDKLSRLRDSLHEIATAKPDSTETAGEAAPGAGGADAGGVAASGTGGGSSSLLDEALKKYYIAISRKVHSNWALPDTQDWDSNLESIAFIVIKRDGTIVETFFEKRSGNIYFDQYVEKTIQAALPMPPFPSDLKEDELEIGLRFRPGGLF